VVKPPWSWQAASLRRALEAAAPHLARDGRVVLVLEQGGPEALVAAVLGGVGAGYRLVEARLADPEEETGGVVELIPPGGILPPPPRTRASARLEPTPGGLGDPALVPGPGLFAAPEPVDARPFSAREAAAVVLETAVEVLQARGEPARYERLLGEILVGLDRSGQLRRMLLAEERASAAEPSGGLSSDVSDGGPDRPSIRREASGPRRSSRGPAGPRATGAREVGAATFRQPMTVRDPVDRALALIRDELGRESQRRIAEIEPGRWWLRDRADREAAAVPLADRVEWAVYSLLSTAGPIAEDAFFERVATLFSGHDLPDEGLVRTCLESYRSPASTAARLMTAEDLRRRTAEHTELLARLANAGHELRMRVWLGRREQGRRIGSGTLADFLNPQEREPWFPQISRARPEDVEAIDCLWYVRGGPAIMFEVEWTAMLGDLLLRRHARIPPDDRIIRILALAPERRELARHRLATSPLLREAVTTGNWHLILWPHLRAWLARQPLDLDALEPFLGLDPPVERRAEQLGLFGGLDPADHR
jgi:hypothetical protein